MSFVSRFFNDFVPMTTSSRRLALLRTLFAFVVEHVSGPIVFYTGDGIPLLTAFFPGLCEGGKARFPVCVQTAKGLPYYRREGALGGKAK
ncbi:hypothetical protein ACLEEB_13135 [Lonsdalea quercina]|uniref:Uncharacterized protein n=2 Tax=Lonsdalea quercina TaxID=71657 RepID=A0A1H4E0S2_9GAMM|nr:hypothetical protein [Lonsdalea quercina]SEA78170.1 hypothetical protein SAMN02982996_02483 [Lonsdalea quercina]